MGIKKCLLYFQGLQFNDTIVHLDPSDVSLAGTAQALDAMFRVNKTLKHLNLSQSQAPREAEDCVDTQGFQHNTTLVYLNLINTGISDEGAENIAQALITSNCSLQTLDISHNHNYYRCWFCLHCRSLEDKHQLENTKHQSQSMRYYRR